ncbi:triose-phosphate isomerase [Desulfosporosinus sp. BICA1-9]|uniref:triose-phosphate isomerase n=1 Tax=Desulfosporosinus sp. BICA1-9 TaxID=1531958 RepID=UPI00054B5E93|nr:triose-phosphate isomerase [Desulfosporosinus sp. BICA1-9]KJS49008.1 MAG: triosephosphate isomerase [Peptococcaceae bacterium BRH_c23]KJS78063.1 MAG: triosephosphate isomerase [Desulfosporosinus sp. BICA1-9]HBW34150.1 triosephosphate isomerase [Desulfosporosinus sp.]
MKQIFINFKRFDVPKSLGGVCPYEKGDEWIEWILDECINYEIGKLEGVLISFMFPESLIVSAVKRLQTYPEADRKAIAVGCQGVYREDVVVGGNFGAFSTNRPAVIAKSLNCSWTMIGHSEERKDKMGIIITYDPKSLDSNLGRQTVKAAVDTILNQELKCAINRGLKVLFCIGETAEDKGDGDFVQQKPRIKAVLKEQLLNVLTGFDKAQLDGNLVIGYEPIWAIGPGKTPPGSEYIAFVSAYIKEIIAKEFNFVPPVVYGGGLKEENAGLISKIDTIDGGLVALTRFTGEIGFYPEELKKIISKYLE